MSPLPRFSIGCLPIQFPQLPYHQTLWAGSFGPILVRPPSSAAGTEDDGNLGQWCPVDPGCGTLGGLGIQLLNLSLASFALQLIIVALAIWHCIHFIATTELTGTRTEAQVGGDTEPLS